MDQHEIAVSAEATHDRLIFASPILSVDRLRRLRDILLELGERRPSRPLILASAHPRIFLAGADLSEIAGLSAKTSASYARLGRTTLALLSSHPSATIAAVCGACRGGGFDLVMSCDLVVSSTTATFSHPGVSRGLVTGWGGTTLLPQRLGRPRARAALLEGRDFPGAELETLGMVAMCTPHALREAEAVAVQMARLHGSRLALWRMVRAGTFVDRFRAFVVHHHV